VPSCITSKLHLRPEVKNFVTKLRSKDSKPVDFHRRMAVQHELVVQTQFLNLGIEAGGAPRRHRRIVNFTTTLTEEHQVIFHMQVQHVVVKLRSMLHKCASRNDKEKPLEVKEACL